MDTKTVLIISEHPADFYSLTAALQRAEPSRFYPVTVNTRDEPVDALMDPTNDAVILAYTLETEYLLRLAKKKNLSCPIIVLIDQQSESQADMLKEAGATDYIVRGLISDDRLHRVLDYSIQLNHITLQYEQLVQQQQVERAAQLGGEHLRTVNETVASGRVVSGPAVSEPAFVESARYSEAPMEDPPEEKPLVRNVLPRTWGGPWKIAILVLVAAVLLVYTSLQDQRLDSESRLSRLEASNDIVSRRLTQVHADLVQIALAIPPVQRAVEPAPLPVIVPSQVVEHLEAVVLEAESEPVRLTTVTVLPEESWFINLGTFGSQGAARRFQISLGESSYPLEVRPVVVNGRELFRVRLINLPSEEVAESLAADYQIKLGGSQPWVGKN